jgi:hypothetical protein
MRPPEASNFIDQLRALCRRFARIPADDFATYSTKKDRRL